MRPSARAAEIEGEDGAVYHGGDLGAARSLFPDAPTPWLDLSTGINATPYPTEAFSQDALTRLPDAHALMRLLTAAASAYGARDMQQIVAAPGTQALIQWLPKLFPARRVAILGFGYQEYPTLWRAAGAEAFVTDDVADLTSPGVDVAIVVNPNNPDGRLIDPQNLAEIATRLARRGGLLIVDEAFMDLIPPGTSLIPLLPERGALVLRSFGKAYGLAGIRLGFAITGFDLAEKLRTALGPWAVSGPAIEIGATALADKDWLVNAAARLAQLAARLDALLTAAGFSILGGTPLFRLARHQHAAQWFQKFGRHGILTRPFPERPDWLRFGLPGAEADWARLAEALKS
ncbi:MAG: threonine-phosphate decarboxylase CobD [Methylovirgula sp.]|uniref:threonine-phosphate decarboxylase CobD n=1 Tax=Methylovirgula sp. TaxID=1978224 RepID=UPI00307603BE